MICNRVLEKLQAGEAVLGCLSGWSNPATAEMLALMGFDFVMLDCEHGPSGWETAESVIRAIEAGGSVPMVRVPENNPKVILRPLDLGALGIMVPQVSSKGEAIAAVRAMRYAPEGDRGLAFSTRAGRYGMTDRSRYLEAANKAIMVILQAETPGALDHLDEIVSVPGISVLFIGPADLSQAVGEPGKADHPKVLQAAERIVDACLKAGVVPGILANTQETINRWYEKGVRFFLANAVTLFVNGCRALLGPFAEMQKKKASS